MATPTQEQTPVTRPLEFYRQEQLMTIEEFARHLGMTPQTYRRLIADPSRVSMPTKRRAREALGVSPYHIKEFYPPVDAATIERARAAIREANAQGWIAVDDDLEPTGERFDANGSLM